MKPLSILILLFGISACGPAPVWIKPGATKQSFEKDKRECVYQARLALAGYGSGRETARRMDHAVGQGIAQGIGQVWETADLAKECLKSRGYRIEGES